MCFVVYFISDPRTYDIFYVGYTRNIQRRIWWHLHHGKAACGARVKEILSDGHEPGFSIVQRCRTEGAAVDAESKLIELLMASGTPLLNKEATSDRPSVKSRVGMPWLVSEDARLISLRGRGKSTSEIAIALGRSKGAILSRLRLKGMV